tara:strand:+ start:73578 stop:73760 length:183 start_codon:yes stop_codon:yes gene_type:complete
VIDYFALALTHALILIAILRVFMRDDLDRENPPGAEPAAAKPNRREARRARRAGGKTRDA